MAQLLHPQDSGFYGRKEMGSRWSFLELFGLRRRLRSTKKMLSDKKHGSKLRGCYVPFKDEDSGVTEEQSRVMDEHSSVKDEHKSTKVTDKQKGSKKSSKLKSLISRKFYGKEDRKEKMLPVGGPKLLRTLSIHYLETNDYVNGQLAANGDGSSPGAKLSSQNGTSTNLQQDTFGTLDGSGTDTVFSQLSSRSDGHVKRKSHRSISMDGVLHKVPYGQRVSEDNIRQELPRSASATYGRDGLKPYIGTAARRHGNRGFRRSRSLSESLESYTHLLDSISSSEAKRVLTSSKSTRDHSLDGPGAATTSQQRTSNSQLRSKSVVRLAEYLGIPEVTLAAEVPEEIAGDTKLSVDESSCDEVAGGSENPVSLGEYLSDKNSDAAASTEADLCIAPVASEMVDNISEVEAATCDDDDQVPPSTQVQLCTDPSASEEVGIPEEHATACDDDDLVHSSTGADPCTLQSLLQSEDINIAGQNGTPSDDQIQSGTAQPLEDIDIAEEPAIISEENQIQPFDALNSAEGTSCVPGPSRDTEDELNLCHEQETESPTSVLDVAFSDHPAASSSENLTVLDDSSSLVEETVHSNEAADDHSVGNGNGDDLESSTSVALPASSPTQENNLSDLSALLEAAGSKREAEMAYVKEVFDKSSFRNEALFDEWCSRNAAVLEDEDCQHFEAAAAVIDFTFLTADELILLDLSNESLLGIYKDRAASKSKQPRFSSFERPKLVGDGALRELRSKVSRHMDEWPESSVEVDDVLSSDLNKADQWNRLRRDADEVANEVADSVLDDLITELALQLRESS